MKLLSLSVLVCLAAACSGRAQAVTAGAVYFVATQGADANPGTADRPFATIGRAAMQAHPGDLVVVQAGTYREAVTLTQSGQPGAPIVFRGLPGAVLTSPDPASSLSAFDFAPSIGYVTLQGFELGGGFAETVFLRPGAHNIELAGLHIHHNRSGIWIAGASDVVVHDCVIDHNFRTGVRMFHGAQRVRIVDTRSEANDDGLGCNGDSDGFNADSTTADIRFERATAIGNSEDGFDLKCPNPTLLQAITRDNGCSGVKLAGGGYVENMLSERNRLGINVDGPAGATTVLQNCTISQNDTGVRGLGDGHTLMMRNCIVTGAAKALTYASSVQVIEHHNTFYRPNATERLIVRMAADGDTLYSAADVNSGKWRSENGQADATVAVDPQLDGTCLPSSKSEAIDSGDGTSAPPTDIVGTARPAGAAVDRGAFERAAAPTLRLRRLAMRADKTGLGQVQLDADVTFGAATGFNPNTDVVTLSVRGARGEALHIEVPAAAWTASQRIGGTLLRTALIKQSGGVQRVTMSVDDTGARLWVSAAVADLWMVDASNLTVDVLLGKMRASANANLASAGGTLFVQRKAR